MNGRSLLIGFLALLWIETTAAQNCTPADITLSTQQSVDSFQQEYGPCDVVMGDLTVVGTNITNLEGLSQLTGVNGRLFVSDCPSLESLRGLRSLSQVGDVLTIQANNLLEDFEGLESLQTVNGDFYIFRNDSLISLRGMESLTLVGNRFWISGNLSLTSIDALSSLKTLHSVRFFDNDGLTNLDGLANVERITWALEVIHNDALTNLDGLSNLHTVDGHLFLEFGLSLQSIQGLENLSKIQWLSIRKNPRLTNLDALNGLTWIGTLSVTYNERLSNCRGIAQLVDPIDDGEPSESTLIPGIPDIDSYLVLNNNLPGCNSQIEVLSSFPIESFNAGLNDAWYNPDTNGQGIVLVVLPVRKEVFLAWFTFDVERPPEDVTAVIGEPGHRWLTAQGKYEGSAALLTAYVTEGGVFDSSNPQPETIEAGQLILEFQNCNSGMLDYSFPDLGMQGEFEIERVNTDNVPLCYTIERISE